MGRLKRIIDAALAGLVGGAWAGALVGFIEAGFLVATGGASEEYWIFPYAIASYGIGGLAIGLAYGLGAGLLPFRRLTDPAFAIGGSLALLALGGAVARYHVVQRVFHEELINLSLTGLAVHGAIVLLMALVAGAFVYASRTAGHSARGVAVSAAALACSFALSCGAAALASPGHEAAVIAPNTVAAPPGAPNVILIIADTLRADALGSYGASPAATPALDLFAKDAVRFTNAYSQSSWTRPSIATILTSLYPSAHGLIHKMDALPDRVTTVAEALGAQGYRTAGFVSNINVAPVFNFQQGFQQYTYLAPEFYFWATDSATRLAIYKGLRVARERLLGDRIYFYNYYQDANVVTRAVTQWLEARPPRPFFLLIHYMDPHDPYFEIPYDGHGVARVSTPDPAPSRKDELHALYGQDVTYLDQHLEKLFAELKSLGLYDDSIIALTADHGEEFQEHGGWWHGTTLYQELVHVPLLVKRAHESRAGDAVEDIARSLDVAPTLVAAAGVTMPREFMGRDLFGPGAVPDGPLFAEEDLEGNVLASLRQGPWKIISANPGNPRGLKTVELYDLSRDAGERHNLAGSDAGQAQTMLQLLAQERARINSGGGVNGLAE